MTAPEYCVRLRARRVELDDALRMVHNREDSPLSPHLASPHPSRGVFCGRKRSGMLPPPGVRASFAAATASLFAVVVLVTTSWPRPAVLSASFAGRLPERPVWGSSTFLLPAKVKGYTRDLEAMQKTLQADSLKPAGVVEDAPNLLAALGDGLSPTIFDGGQDPLDADGDKTTQIDAVTLDDMIHQAARGHQLVLQARDQLHLLQSQDMALRRQATRLIGRLEGKLEFLRKQRADLKLRAHEIAHMRGPPGPRGVPGLPGTSQGRASARTPQFPENTHTHTQAHTHTHRSRWHLAYAWTQGQARASW